MCCRVEGREQTQSHAELQPESSRSHPPDPAPPTTAAFLPTTPATREATQQMLAGKVQSRLIKAPKPSKKKSSNVLFRPSMYTSFRSRSCVRSVSVFRWRNQKPRCHEGGARPVNRAPQPEPASLHGANTPPPRGTPEQRLSSRVQGSLTTQARGQWRLTEPHGFPRPVSEESPGFLFHPLEPLGELAVAFLSQALSGLAPLGCGTGSRGPPVKGAQGWRAGGSSHS